MIEGLSKEKNYYIRKCEQQLKQLQQQANNSISNKDAQSFQERIDELEKELKESVSTLKEAQ